MVKFMQQTYREFAPQAELAHLPQTISQFFGRATPLWFVELEPSPVHPLGCLWLGNAVDQLQGDRYTHVLLIYIDPAHRRRGLGRALIGHAETWACQRGDRQLGLQVFQANLPAVQFYQALGYQTQVLGMVKSLINPI